MDPPPVPRLMDEIEEEVLVRVAPDDPATLLRAALVCKRWCGLISGANFRRRFRELHAKPPVLGLLRDRPSGRADFVPASSASFRAPHAVRATANWRVLDARHGRVLFYDTSDPRAFAGTNLVVWDPVTDATWRIPALRSLLLPWSAALLCAAATAGSCDHIDCRRRGGAFVVVVVNTDEETPERKVTSAYVYSSEEGAWSKPASLQHQGDCIKAMARGALVGNALYFSYHHHTRILEYDLGRQQLSEIDVPSKKFRVTHFVIMETEEGGLGFATIQIMFRLSLWWREAGPNGHAGWVRRRVIELDKLLPASYCDNNVVPPYIVAVADGIGVFIWKGRGLFSVHLKSSQVEKIGDFSSHFKFVPYVSFCTPALDLASTGGGGSRGNTLSTSQT